MKQLKYYEIAKNNQIIKYFLKHCSFQCVLSVRYFKLLVLGEHFCNVSVYLKLQRCGCSSFSREFSVLYILLKNGGATFRRINPQLIVVGMVNSDKTVAINVTQKVKGIFGGINIGQSAFICCQSFPSTEFVMFSICILPQAICMPYMCHTISYLSQF